MGVAFYRSKAWPPWPLAGTPKNHVGAEVEVDVGRGTAPVWSNNAAAPHSDNNLSHDWHSGTPATLNDSATVTCKMSAHALQMGDKSGLGVPWTGPPIFSAGMRGGRDGSSGLQLAWSSASDLQRNQNNQNNQKMSLCSLDSTGTAPPLYEYEFCVPDGSRGSAVSPGSSVWTDGQDSSFSAIGPYNMGTAADSTTAW